MPWQIQDVANTGQYLMVQKVDGIFIDPFATISADDLKTRVAQFAVGWELLHINWTHGLGGGLGESIQFYGRATTPVPTAMVRAQVIEALDSFLLIGASDVAVTVSDNFAIVPPGDSNSWSNTLQYAAIAVIAVALVWGISQIRSIIDE